MLTKGQMNKYADVLLWGLKTSREGHYKRGDIIMLHFELQAIRLAEVLQGKLLDMGMNHLQWDEFDPALYRLILELDFNGSKHYSSETFGMVDFKSLYTPWDHWAMIVKPLGSGRWSLS